MRTKNWIAAALLCLPIAFAQTKPSELTERIYTVRYANVSQLRQLLGVYSGRITLDEHSGVIAVRDTPETLDAIGEVIKRLDVPPAVLQNVEIDVYMLAASQGSSSGSLPKELDPVVKQLKGIFNYQDYRLLETAVTRARDGGHAVLNGFIPTQFDGLPIMYFHWCPAIR